MAENENDKGKRGERRIPLSRLKRSSAAASTGVKMGSNYARYLARKATGTDRDTARKKMHEQNARDLFKQVSKLRGTALKMAQGLSLHSAFLPEEFTSIIAQAQYKVPPMNPALVRRLIKTNLGQYPEDVFAVFNPEALAAASLGQVHEARLHDGRHVAVKVQYPNVRESIDTDLKMMKTVGRRFLNDADVDIYLNEIRDRLFEETDYTLEGQNIELFAERYADESFVTPRWVPDLTTERVLTMTFVEGLHIDQFMATSPTVEQRNHFGQLLFDFAHRQITGDHLTVHADAHPGNFLIREDGKIGILDFGCVKTFPRKFRDDLLRLFTTRLFDDRERTLQLYRDLEFVRDDQTDQYREFLIDVLDRVTKILIEPYKNDTCDFSDGVILNEFRSLVPMLTGRDALTHRGPVGSPHFVFVNRLVIGFFSMLTDLGATVNVVKARQMLLDGIGQPLD